MRTCGALALRPPSSEFPACAWPPPPASTPDSKPPRRCAQPSRLRPLPDRGSWHLIYINKHFPPVPGWSRADPLEIQSCVGSARQVRRARFCQASLNARVRPRVACGGIALN
eukprot:6211969-Pleurochrysis_carterae.AAC.6